MLASIRKVIAKTQVRQVVALRELSLPSLCDVSRLIANATCRGLATLQRYSRRKPRKTVGYVDNAAIAWVAAVNLSLYAICYVKRKEREEEGGCDASRVVDPQLRSVVQTTKVAPYRVEYE